MKILTVRCPSCKQRMKYQSRDANLKGKVKKCVYCGFSINVIKNFKN